MLLKIVLAPLASPVCVCVCVRGVCVCMRAWMCVYVVCALFYACMRVREHV